MSRLGRLFFGCTVLGVAAATVYYYLEENSKDSVCDVDDDLFDDDEDETEADQAAEEVEEDAEEVKKTQPLARNA